MPVNTEEKPKKVTIRTVAEDAGVSVAAVSKVMRNAYGVSDSLREKVEESIAKLGYRPSTAARAMRGKTLTVGVLLIDLTNPFLPPLLRNISDELESKRYKMMIAAGESSLQLETALIDQMIDFQLDGLILISPRMPGDKLASYAKQIPMVIIGHHEPSANAFDTVNSDDRRGGEIATQSLLDSGHQKVWMLSLGDELRDNEKSFHVDDRPSGPREIGYRSVMENAGLADEINVVPANLEWDTDVFDTIIDAQNRPSAVFAWSDLAAVPFLDRCKARGLKVPEEMAVVGYDNNNLAALEMISLSSIDQNDESLAKCAVSTLLTRIDGRTTAEHLLIEPQLVQRKSS